MLGIYSVWCPLIFLDLWFGINTNFGEILSYCCFKYCFCCLLSSFSATPITHVTRFVVVPQFLYILSFIFFPVIFLFVFSLEVSTVISSSLEILSSVLSSLLMGLSKTFFIYVSDSDLFLFDSFLEFPFLYLHYPILVCCPHFPLEASAY